MSRLVVPELLVLRLGALSDAFRAGRVGQVGQKFGPQLRKRAHDTREPGDPVSLRWVANPMLGFPRAPFEVWRRSRKEEPTNPLLGAAAPVAPATVPLPNEVIEIRFEAQPTSGRTLTVEALSAAGKVLPGQLLSFTANQFGRFRAAGIAALRLSGQGTIATIGTLVQSDWANLPDWIRIEVVGFPFDPGQLPTAVYDPGKQGWEMPSLSGRDAARQRLGVAQILQLDPPAVGGGLVAPPWPFPDPATFLDVLRKGPLADIEQCLKVSDDTDSAKMQALHVVDRSLPGLRQPGQQPGPDPASLALTTTQYIALAVHDGPVALGLGFGTIDIPPFGQYTPPRDLMPPGAALGRDEYMVTAKFTIASGITLELAAIGHRAAPPPGLAGLQAEQTFINRATQRDGAESVAVRVTWTAPAEQVGTGLLVRRPPAATSLINPPRPAGSEGFEPYLTEHRIADDGNPPGDLRPGVTMPEEAVPVSGSSVTAYAAAPMDIHGRWGPWRLTSHTVASRPVQKPGLHEISLALPATLPATGPVASGSTLTVDVSWDWADRSPAKIEIFGAFVPLGPPPAAVSGFQVDSSLPAAPGPLVISFSLSGVPSVPLPANVVEVLDSGAPPPAGSAASEVRRYRLVLPVMKLSFATANELAFAVSARGAERIRPTELSAAVDPRATNVGNPFPAPPPSLPSVTVLWTAQADASGRARTVLSWPPVPAASGYIVWEATEAALFHAVSGGGSPTAGQGIRARAADLKTRVAANQAASLESFSRLNERPMAATAIELVLPGSADTLYAYRVSSITAQNIESARSTDIVLVGVPHRNVPGTPRLEARPDAANEQVELTVVPGHGLLPTALRIHRVRRESLAGQIGTMGPPVISVLVASLTPVSVVGRSGPVEIGWRFTDAVDASWQPYVYRCVAVGKDAPDDGIRAGDSPPSGMVRVLVAPTVPPLISGAVRAVGLAGTLLRFTTDLPFAPTSAGIGTLTIASVSAGQRTVLARRDSSSIEVGLPLSAVGPSATGVKATRRAAVSGVADVTVLLPLQATGAIVLTATDPLGRSTTVELG